MKVDCLIVGSGLAGLCFAETLYQHGRSFALISDDSQQASEVAGGLYNPLILKRFTLAFKAAEQLDLAIPFYQTIEARLGQTLDFKQEVLRIMHDAGEQNRWFESRDRSGYSRFMDEAFVDSPHPNVEAPHKLARVLETGRLDTAAFRKAYIAWLKSAGLYVEARFEHAQLKLSESTATYQQFEADKVIFAEGFGLKQNPFFNHLPLQGSKGELLTIYAPELDLQPVLKSTVFIIPLGNHRYRVGATYDNHRLNNLPTEEARAYLLERLRKFLKVDFEVEAHVAGVRPSVSDRKPLVGRHPQHAQLAVLNGFGSRGVMIAPFAADALYRNLFEGTALDLELDIRRFAERSKQPQGRS